MDTNRTPGIRGHHRLIAKAVGYDVFIAYRQGEARQYAKALHDALEARNLVVFLDEADEGAGGDIERFVQFACSARCLVVVVTPGVYQSPYVRQELASYLDRRMRSWAKRAFSRIIPVNVDNALSHAPENVDAWKNLKPYVFAPERADAVARGQPSAAVVDTIARSSRFVRAGAMFALAVGALTAVVMGLLGGASWALKAAGDDLAVAETQIASAKKQQEALDKANRNLELEGNSLKLRKDAIRALDYDPTKAYRLAEAAESLLPSPENREIIRSVISSGSMLYRFTAPGCTYMDSHDQLVLLRCKEGEKTNALKLLDLSDLSIRHLPHPAETAAWIVPTTTSWRLLTLGETEIEPGQPGYSSSGINQQRQYRVLDATGVQIGAPVFGRFLTLPDQRCGTSTAFIASSGQVAGTLWNLITNDRVTVSAGAAPLGLETTMACRMDGARAIKSLSGLHLVDAAGKAVSGGSTHASFDYLDAHASWSPSGRHLAVHIPRQGRLAVWDPASKSWTDLDPDRWLATAYAWTPSGRGLAFAGNAENQLAATVEIVEAAAPTPTRKPLYLSQRPVRAIVFSPDERQLAVLDDKGALAIVDSSTGETVRSGQHDGARTLAWMNGAILTSSTGELRVWSPDALPRERWLYRSTAESTLGQCAATDTASRWHAVFAFNPSRTTEVGQVIVRSLKNGADQMLPQTAGDCFKLFFSGDGAWLVHLGFRTAYAWSTATWQKYELPLQDGDRQYFGSHEADGRLHLHVLHSNPDGNFVYDVLGDPKAGPTVVARRQVEEFHREECPPSPAERTAGWHEAFDQSRYTYRGARDHCPGDPWERRIWCRSVLADCDAEFVPIDLKLATDIYDPIVWRPRQGAAAP